MSDPDYITRSDVAMLDHFFNERGDIARWVDWEKRKPVFEKQFPELMAALKAFEIAEKTLNIIAHSITDKEHTFPET